jgi:hypothetical protein
MPISTHFVGDHMAGAFGQFTCTVCCQCGSPVQGSWPERGWSQLDSFDKLGGVDLIGMVLITTKLCGSIQAVEVDPLCADVIMKYGGSIFLKESVVSLRAFVGSGFRRTICTTLPPLHAHPHECATTRLGQSEVYGGECIVH